VDSLQQPAWAARFRAIGASRTFRCKVRLLTRFSTSKKEECGSPVERNTKRQLLPPSWEWADLFGELCLAGYPLRTSTAVALTISSIRTIHKAKMLQMLRKKNKLSNSLGVYLLFSVKKYQDHVAELLTSSAEQRLARVLLRLAHLDKRGPPVVEIPNLSHQVLAEMVGTTRPRVNLFMNRFRKQGFIDYDGGLEVRQSLRKALRRH
jgi:Crp-like helix-turn-helix protein